MLAAGSTKCKSTHLRWSYPTNHQSAHDYKDTIVYVSLPRNLPFSYDDLPTNIYQMLHARSLYLLQNWAASADHFATLKAFADWRSSLPLSERLGLWELLTACYDEGVQGLSYIGVR